MSKIEIYSKGYCPYCKQAKATLASLGLQYEEYEITNSEALQLEMRERSQRTTVPQIFIDNQHIGGGDDFHKALRNGELNKFFESTTN
ncbi:glutaredoxin 3 [Pseudocolwellia agarivorans]|uniref:glutaredoxin 3 n=1 Tax=Pseudocolwellia agarivorans TaxID=1911682 RepID=UPI003F88366D